MGDAFNDVGNIGKDPLFLRRLDHFISDLLLARSHLEQGLDTELGEAAERLQVFLKTAEKTLPKAARDKAERCKDFSLTDACANPGVLPSHKRLAYRSHPIDFFTIMSKILPAISALPRIVATIPDAPAVNADDPALPLDDPLVVTVGEVLHLASDGGPYYVLVTDLVDPQSFEATFAVAYGVRMWTAPDIAALGAPAPLGFEGHLGEGEVALSKFKELVRPSTILGRMRLVPGWWSDPVDAGSCLCYNIFFDYRRLTLSPIDFRLQSEPWRVLHWLRCRAVSYNDNSRRTWDFVVDRMYHAFYDHFLSFKPSVTKENKLINLNIVVERDWLLQAPLSVLKTAKFSEGDESGTLAMWVQTRDEAEQVLGPSAHSEMSSAIPDSVYIIKPGTGETYIDRFRFGIQLPIVLWHCPQKEGETDLLYFKAHMMSLAEPAGKKDGQWYVQWRTQNVVQEKIEVGVMPS